MLKVVTPESFGFTDRIAELVKVSSRGLRSHDLGVFTKRAGHDFLPSLEEVRPGEVPMHLIALGATEYVGFNRNADGFKAAACRRYHDTFVKFAHWFHDHQNRRDSPRYGRVIKSAYHEPMGRVELLVGLYGTDEAARRGGGEHGRVASEELEKLARDESLDTSMSCRIPFDVCEFCHNKAAHRGEYCDTVPVKLASGRTIPACSGFGCRHGLTKVAADGRVQGVDNPDPTWFDISRVGRGACRVAFTAGLLGDHGYAMKAASAGGAVAGGAALAAEWGIAAPLLIAPGTPAKVARRVAVLAGLVDEANRSQHMPTLAKAALLDPPRTLRGAPTIQASYAFRALTDAGVCLDPAAWLTLTLGKDAAADAADDVARAVTGELVKLSAAPDVADVLAGDEYDPGRCEPPAEWSRWAAKVAADHSLHADAVERRARLAAIRGVTPAVKSASDADPGPGAEKVAREYVRYQVAFLGAQPEDFPELGLFRSLIVRLPAVV